MTLQFSVSFFSTSSLGIFSMANLLELNERLVHILLNILCKVYVTIMLIYVECSGNISPVICGTCSKSLFPLGKGSPTLSRPRQSAGSNAH